MRAYLVCGLMASCMLCSTASAAVSLTVNGKTYDTLPLKLGQAVQVEIYSDTALPYSAYAGFDDGTDPLGTLSDPRPFGRAGNLASISPVTAPPLEGYYVNAAGTSPAPAPGAHFKFTYTPETFGQTILKLYDGSLSTVLDRIVITVESAQTGTAFTYQGRLLDDNQAAGGLYDMVFSLLDAPSEGGKVGDPIALEDVEVVDGYFVVTLDFGDAFGADARWLQTAVRPGDSTGDYTTLTPRQRLTPTPQAAWAAKSDWNTLVNIPAGFADGADDLGLTAETDPTVPAYIKDGLSWTEILGIPAGFADGIDNGLLTETDPTVPASIKDGLSWAEISSIPAGFADGVDNDTTLSETQVETYITNDINTGYMPYDNGTKLVSSPLRTNGQETALGTTVNTGRKLNVRTDSDTYGFYSENAITYGEKYGIYAAATGNTSDSSYGLFGSSSSGLGHNFGVWGEATTPTPYTNYAIFGSAANSGTGGAFAGYFSGNVYASGNVGIGITAPAAKLEVVNTASTESAIAIKGIASNASGFYKTGVYGQAAGEGGYGVYGQATGAYGRGVYGQAAAENADGVSGYSVYRYGVYGSSSYSDGVYGYSYDYNGVSGYSHIGDGVSGDSSEGDGVVGHSSNGYGVYGSSNNNDGVYGYSYDYNGVHGYSVEGYGVYGDGLDAGVYGSSSLGYGVHGYSVAGYGVYGSSAQNYAGYFNGSVFVAGIMSAGTVVDRTPYPKDLQTAYNAVMSMERLSDGQYQEDDKEQQLDHSKLSPFIQSDDGHRDLSATVSCQNEVLKDLIRRTEQLEEARATIRRLEQRLVEIQEQNARLERLEKQMNQLMSAGKVKGI